MSFDFSTVKWGWVVIGTIVAAIVAIVLNLIIQFGYGLVIGFQLRGAPPQEMLIEAFMSLPFLIVGVVVAFVAAFIGSRMAAKRSEDNPQSTALATGVLAALAMIGLRAWQWSFDIWVLPHVVVAVLGGWVAGNLVAKAQSKRMD